MHTGTDKPVRLLLITTDDVFCAYLEQTALRWGWEMRRATGVHDGLGLLRAWSGPLVIVDWTPVDSDWRSAVERLGCEAQRPYVMLASRVVDDNLRDEVVRLGGHHVLPRNADREKLAREINFAWFWITHARGRMGVRGQEEARP